MSTTYTSAWKDRLQDTMQKILNRESFSYDINADALYRQYKDSYLRQGRQAMEDTMGRTAALTGGYGNSYAQTASQQTYQGYLQQLNDRIPQLQQAALDRYNAEGNRLQSNAALLQQQENLDYSQFRNQLADRNTAFDRLLALMTGYGYRPTAEELENSGMTADHVLAVLGPEAPAAAVSRSKEGVYDPEVLELQKLLNRFGAGLTLDGINGPKTKAAKKKYSAELNSHLEQLYKKE